LRFTAGVRVSQYVYFALSSKVLPASAITELLLVEPNRVRVRGSRNRKHDIPRSHLWAVECDEPGLYIAEQVAKVLERVLPVADAIAALRQSHPDVAARLQLVRTYRSGFWPKRGGDSLGWHLDRKTLDFLQVTGAELDVDEYR
jgi:hypothetical protein